jgi:hypothetical protein
LAKTNEIEYENRNCLMNDADEILSLYEAARDLQTQKKMVIWPFFEKSFIEKKIQRKDNGKLCMKK